MEIEVDFAKFLPTLGVFYNYFEILKSHSFIQDVTVVDKEGSSVLRVYRHTDELIKL